jgi:hypothetical protein
VPILFKLDPFCAIKKPSSMKIVTKPRFSARRLWGGLSAFQHAFGKSSRRAAMSVEPDRLKQRYFVRGAGRVRNGKKLTSLQSRRAEMLKATAGSVLTSGARRA